MVLNLSLDFLELRRGLLTHRHQLPRVAAQEELAERKVASPEDDDGQARPSLLSDVFASPTPPRTTGP